MNSPNTFKILLKGLSQKGCSFEFFKTDTKPDSCARDNLPLRETYILTFVNSIHISSEPNLPKCWDRETLGLT
jgi:hypothetical protein